LYDKNDNIYIAVFRIRILIESGSRHTIMVPQKKDNGKKTHVFEEPSQGLEVSPEA
jgi:hypothetical protein